MINKGLWTFLCEDKTCKYTFNNHLQGQIISNVSFSGSMYVVYIIVFTLRIQSTRVTT